MIKNTGDQSICFEMLSTTDGSIITSGTPTVYVLGDGGTQATGSGTSVHEGNGVWSYIPTQAETNYAHIAFTMSISGAFVQTVNIYTTTPQTGDAYSAIGLLNDVSTDDVNAQCDIALADYGANTTTPPTTSEITAHIDANSTQLSAILEDSGTTIPGLLASIDTLIDGIKATTDNLPDSGALTSIAQAVNLSTVDTVVDGIQADLSNATDGLGALKALIDAISPTSISDAVWDELLSGHTTAGTAGIALATASSGGVDVSVLADAVWDEAISGHTTAGTFGAKNQNLIPSESVSDYKADVSTLASASNQTTIINHLNDVKGTTFSGETDSLEAIRDRGDAAWITGAAGSAPSAEEIRSEIDTNSTKLAAIVADTNDLQTNQGSWATATGFATSDSLSTVATNIDTLISRLTSVRAGYIDKLNVTGDIAHSDDASTYKADVSSVSTSAEVAALDVIIDAIRAKTDNLPVDPADQSDVESAITATESALDLKISDILTNTGTTIPSQISALNNMSVADLIAGVTDGGYDLQEMLRIIFAFAAGKSTGGGTNTINFRSSADDKNRITATVDESGNRTAIALDGE